MGFSRFLAELYKLIRFLKGQSVKIHTINGFIEMLRGSAYFTFCAIALSKGIVTRKGIIWIVQQCLKLLDSIIPTPLLLIQPPQKVTSIRSIKAIGKNLFTEIDSIGVTTLGLKSLSLSKHTSNLASCYSCTRN